MNRFIMIVSLFSFFFQACSGQTRSLTVGDPVPVFTLRDQNDSLFKSPDHVGKEILVIFFYPKDESSICTKEACSFRDNFNDFAKAGATVIGINYGTVASHRQFAQHHQLPFTLLSDPGNKVLKMFGVKSKFLFTGRETFVVDKTGKIVFTFDSFTKGTAHEQEALTFIKNMQAKR